MRSRVLSCSIAQSSCPFLAISYWSKTTPKLNTLMPNNIEYFLSIEELTQSGVLRSKKFPSSCKILCPFQHGPCCCRQKPALVLRRLICSGLAGSKCDSQAERPSPTMSRGSSHFSSVSPFFSHSSFPLQTMNMHIFAQVYLVAVGVRSLIHSKVVNGSFRSVNPF